MRPTAVRRPPVCPKMLRSPLLCDQLQWPWARMRPKFFESARQDTVTQRPPFLTPSLSTLCSSGRQRVHRSETSTRFSATTMMKTTSAKCNRHARRRARSLTRLSSRRRDGRTFSRG
eukprot:Amastigsp_a843646_146.p3 type:complete len:117 gc:universal Amastigsp_a843646_146:64-414(+)